jgi:DNA-directed RNA polymerase subunit beta'
VLKNSLFYFKKKNNQLFLRKATPFFLTKGAILRYQEEDFVEKGENFAILVNYKKQTEDIVQGLPKIEELIELRGNSQNAILCEKPGMIYRIESSNKDYELEVIEKEQTTIYFIESLENLLIKKYDFLTLGEPITTGTIDPHELLRIFCNFYYKKDGIIKGLYKALYKLQQILVNSIQAIYKSQGIDISDKHLEIIVRQMSSKIEIRDPGDSPMLPGENLEVYLIEDLCNILSKNSYRIPSFQPILAGVTRSSLKSESFLSSSSFQETRKMLAEAAIEGKVDWLRSLKGNVITGKPIPAGTGFNHFKEYYNHPDLFDLVKFFKYRENQETQKIKSTIDETIQTNIKKKTKNF